MTTETLSPKWFLYTGLTVNMVLFKAIADKNFKFYEAVNFLKIPIKKFCKKIFLDCSENEENWYNPHSVLYIREFFMTSLYS